MTNKPTLEPCPLPNCNGEAVFEHPVTEAVVRCSECGLSLTVSYDASIITRYKKGRELERGAVLAQWNTRTAPEPTAKDALQAIADLPPVGPRNWEDELNADLNLRRAEVNGQETAYRVVEALFDKPPRIECKQPPPEPQGYDEWYKSLGDDVLKFGRVILPNDAYNAGYVAAANQAKRIAELETENANLHQQLHECEVRT